MFNSMNFNFCHVLKTLLFINNQFLLSGRPS